MEVESTEDGTGTFANLKFVGEKFAHANLPLDYLDNIASYMRILRELAVEIWHEMHPERSRLPRGFKERLSLSFTGVADGSANTAVSRDPYQDQKLLIEDYDIDYLTLAQSRFLKVIRAANDNRVPDKIPQSIRSDLKLLLSNVNDGERLEIISLTGKDHQQPSVNYSSTTRDRLVQAIRAPGISSIDGLGILSGIDDTLEHVKITSEHGVFFYPVSRNRIRSEFHVALNQTVEFQAKVKTLPSGRIASVEEPISLDLVAASDEHRRLHDRLDHLSRLNDGWKDGDGISITSKALHSARDIAGFLAATYSGIAAFPTIMGGITFEFSHRSVEATVLLSDDVIVLEAFDDGDADIKSQAFFAVTPKLLAHLIDLEAFLQ